MKNRAKKISPEFTSKTLTNHAGILPIDHFLRKQLSFDKAIENGINLPIASNTKYDTSTIFKSIIYGYLADFKHLSHFSEFTKDQMIQKLLGIKSHIDENTIGYRLNFFNFKKANHLQEILGKLGKKVRSQYLDSTRLIIDIDSTVKGSYGNQEGSRKGYNEKKRGQKSFHPQMAWITSTKECLHSWFRPGDTYSGNGTSEFIKECHVRLPEEVTALYRCDSAYFDNKTLSVIEAQKDLYLIKVKLRNMKHLISSCEWEDIPGYPSIAYSELMYQAQGWDQPRKLVFIRRLVTTHIKGLLFSIPEYDYTCYVTNLEEAPLEIYHQYKDRGECENWIAAVKGQLNAGTTIMNHFWGSDVLWNLAVLAYNLTIWIRYLTDRKVWRQEPATFRAWFIRVAGKLIYRSRQYTLKMPKDYYYRDTWWRLYTELLNIKLV